jgi:hypothetical protein
MFSGLSQILGDRLQQFHVDSDLLIALFIVWFLIGDSDDCDNDLLLLIGALLFLGL